MKKVAIIIVNWNGRTYLEDCLDSVFKQTYKNFEVYFIDNGSTDDSVSFIINKYRKVKVILLNKNYGFAKGNNEGIKEAFKDKKVEYIVCLNNDTIVDKNWLKELVKTAEKNSKICGVSSKAYFTGGKIIQNAGLIYSNVLQINQKGGISLGYGKTDKEIPELSADCEIFCPGGVAPLYKRKVLEKIYTRQKEIFDEDFHSYVEDYDLGFRIRKLGYICYLSANAKLIHLHSKTGGVASPFKAYYCERNTYLTAIKNLPFLDLVLFPSRNLALKMSYFYTKNDSVENLKGKIGFGKMFWILVKANFVALLLILKFLRKRWRR